MSNSNSSKGISKLASVLQDRMVKVAGRNSSISVEKGEIISGKRLKLYSIPDAILGRDDYMVCVSIQKENPLKVGDLVLVVWTFDGDPVVIDKITDANRI